MLCNSNRFLGFCGGDRYEDIDFRCRCVVETCRACPPCDSSTWLGAWTCPYGNL